MTELFRRKYQLTVGTLKLTEFDITFQIERSLKREPNTCEINIFNLSPDHRKELHAMKTVPVSLEAGYEEKTAMIFSGDLRECFSIRDGADVITTVASGDGGKAYRASRINKSFGPKTNLDYVLRETAKALKVGIGNAAEAVKSKGLEGVGALFSGGTVLSGNSAQELDRLLDSSGMEWSIQSGNLQVLPKGKALAGTAVLLSSETGLIGSPTVDAKGVVRAICLMIPDVFPGRKVKIEAENLNGVYRVEKATYAGDTAGTDWQIELECKVPK